MINKKPELEELTLREKIGQTAVMQMSWFMNRKDLKEYLKENPMGNVWLNGNWCMNTTNLTGMVVEHFMTAIITENGHILCVTI